MKMSTHEITNQILSLDVEDKDYSQKRMKLMVQYLKEYIETYDKQYHYENYSDTILIDDILYGLGVALDPKAHQYADGYETWKNKLIQYLTKT